MCPLWVLRPWALKNSKINRQLSLFQILVNAVGVWAHTKLSL